MERGGSRVVIGVRQPRIDSMWVVAAKHTGSHHAETRAPADGRWLRIAYAVAAIPSHRTKPALLRWLGGWPKKKHRHPAERGARRTCRGGFWLASYITMNTNLLPVMVVRTLTSSGQMGSIVAVIRTCFYFYIFLGASSD